MGLLGCIKLETNFVFKLENKIIGIQKYAGNVRKQGRKSWARGEEKKR